MAIYRQPAIAAAASTAPLIRPAGVVAMKTSAQGAASAMCRGRLTRFGIRPEKISHRWKPMETAPSVHQNWREERDMVGLVSALINRNPSVKPALPRPRAGVPTRDAWRIEAPDQVRGASLTLSAAGTCQRFASATGAPISS